MVVASCPQCGWQRDYAFQQGASLGLKRHRQRGCQTYRPGGNSPRRQATLDERESARWRELVVEAGLPTERPVQAWMAHPYALDDLLRVLSGTRLEKIAQERRRLKQLSA